MKSGFMLQFQDDPMIWLPSIQHIEDRQPQQTHEPAHLALAFALRGVRGGVLGDERESL